ncbi:haloacid dehalogenase, type II [Mycolicibacterium litorale]|nr:haloacid dehalogenase, type II [Mycolicibacterium litorale]
MRFRAYLFDVQGTLLDFFGPVSGAVAEYLSRQGETGVDAADFTRAWRDNYFQRVRSSPQSRESWRRVHDEYVAGFADVAARYGLPAPEPDTAQTVAHSWTRLQPWPDVRTGLAQVRAGAITATLSNTDMSTAISLFKGLSIDMDAILTAEIFGVFKPDPQVYLRALQYLGVRPAEAAMVASHPYDLEAAQALGLGTVFVSRPLEYGDPALAHEMPTGSVTQHVDAIGQIE